MGVCGSVSQKAANLAQASVYFVVEYFYLVLNELFYFRGILPVLSLMGEYRTDSWVPQHNASDIHKQNIQTFSKLVIYLGFSLYKNQIDLFKTSFTQKQNKNLCTYLLALL